MAGQRARDPLPQPGADDKNGMDVGLLILSEIKYAFVIMILFGSSLSTGKELFLAENGDFTVATVKWTYQAQDIDSGSGANTAGERHLAINNIV